MNCNSVLNQGHTHPLPPRFVRYCLNLISISGKRSCRVLMLYTSHKSLEISNARNFYLRLLA